MCPAQLGIEALKKYIGDDVPIYSFITFSERCTLKNIAVSNPLVRVINRGEVSSTVAALGKQSETVLSKNEILGIYETLYPFTQVSKAVKEQHIESIRATHSETTAGAFPTTSNNEELLCPKCGASLVLRTAKRGNNAGKQFYGCSNYPQCHFIKNI